MRMLDRFRGCLIGGAVGDALGYEVEFLRREDITLRFGQAGITEYVLHDGYAVISDDTQMTLFTANALLNAAADGFRRDVRDYLADAYVDWLETQGRGYFDPKPGKHCWLNNVSRLNHPRAPGQTCINNLAKRNFGSVREPKNYSKGCGGVMRVAPVGLFYEGLGLTVEDIDLVAANAAALTHGHELGYIPAAALAHIVYSLAHTEHSDLEKAVLSAVDTMPRLFPEAKYMEDFRRIMADAVEDSHRSLDVKDCIQALGEGWVGEEALAIAVFCALRFENDFEAAVIAAANHDGDSDSTAAIAGNILGAKLGLHGIPPKFLEHLELMPVLTEIADDLYYLDPKRPDWEAKYITHTYNV